MFRRSMQVLLGCVMLVLAVTLGYAMLGMAGPRKHLDGARLEFEAGHYSACVRLLDTVENSLGPNSEVALRDDLLDLRWRALNEMGNWSLALRDVRRLREIRPDDLELGRAEVRLAIQSGDPEDGLALADVFIAQHPGDGEVYGLAGEACQALYQPLIAELLNQLRTRLDARSAELAIAALRSWLYRDPQDPLGSLGLEHFSEIVRSARRELLTSSANRQRLEEINELVQRAQNYFRRALEQVDAPVGAYAGVSFAMVEAKRDDDRQWLGELYLRRFDHIHTIVAAIDLLDLHIQHKRWNAVVEVADQFLPAGTWQARLEAGTIDSRVAEVYLAKARACEQLNDEAGIATVAAEVIEIVADGRLDLAPASDWVLAINARVQKQVSDCMKLLAKYDAALARLEPTAKIVGNRIRVLEERIELAKRQNWGGQFFEYTNRLLARLDPTNPQRYLEQTYLHIEASDPASALIDVRNARRIDAQNEEVLRAQAIVQNERAKVSGRDAASILKRCIQLGLTLPTDAPDEILPLIAEEALRLQPVPRPDIARDCADLATRRFPWARWPRHLLVQACFALNDDIGAQRAAEDFLAFHPRDEQALVDLRRARTEIGVPHADLLRDLMISGRRDGVLAADLLRAAADSGDIGFARHLAATVELKFRDEPEALLAVADVYERLGRLEDARRTLGDVSADTIRDDPLAFRRSFARYVILSARTAVDDAELRVLVHQFIELNADQAAELELLARELQAAGRPELAYLAITPILTEKVHRERRTGSHFLLAGRLALALGLTTAAEQHFIAALAFPDGGGASRDLTLLQLTEGRETEARNSFWETDVTDLVSACLAARFDRNPLARGWIRKRLDLAPADLPALALAGVLRLDRGLPNPADPLARANRAVLLDAITFLDAPGFEHIARARIDELLSDGQNDPIARCLLARLLVHQGKPDEALQILQGVIRDAPLLVSAYDEAAAIIESSGFDLLQGARLEDEFVRPEVMRSGLATSRMIALATRTHVRTLLGQLGDRVERADELVDVWTASASSGSVGLQHVDLLASIGRTDLALRLVEALEEHLPPEQRARFLATYFHLASLTLESTPDPDLETQFRNRAEQILRESGPTGPVVNFLIDREVALRGPLIEPPDDPRIQRVAELLDAYFRTIRQTPNVSLVGLEPCLQRLAEVRGRAVALEALDERLEAEPTQLPLWELRANWLIEEGEAARALESLRWSYAYLPLHPIALRAVEVAARYGDVQAADLEAFDGLMTDPAISASPEARFTGALLAIRRADYETAANLLSGDMATPDGAHLYYRGLALLESGKIDEARECLTQLIAGYPGSALTSSAGHFASQLAP